MTMIIALICGTEFPVRYECNSASCTPKMSHSAREEKERICKKSALNGKCLHPHGSKQAALQKGEKTRSIMLEPIGHWPLAPERGSINPARQRSRYNIAKFTSINKVRHAITSLRFPHGILSVSELQFRMCKKLPYILNMQTKLCDNNEWEESAPGHKQDRNGQVTHLKLALYSC